MTNYACDSSNYFSLPMEPMKPSDRHHPQGAEHRNELHMAEVSEQNVNMKFRIPPPFPASPASSSSSSPHLVCVCATLYRGLCFVFVFVFLCKVTHQLNISPDLMRLLQHATCHFCHIRGLSLVPNKHCIISNL